MEEDSRRTEEGLYVHPHQPEEEKGEEEKEEGEEEEGQHQQKHEEEEEEKEEEKEEEEEEELYHIVFVPHPVSPPRKRTKLHRQEDPHQQEAGSALPCLPHDLIISNIVASRLPLSDLIRARAVCKLWRLSIFSPMLSQHFLSNSHCLQSRLLLEHSSPCGPSLAAYDSYVDNWLVIPTPSSHHLVAASGGLFCFAAAANSGRVPSLMVGNPVTYQWRHLAAIPLSVPAHGPQIVAMSVNAMADSYIIVVLFGLWDDDASDAYLPFVYESTTGKWLPRNTVPAPLLFETSHTIVKPPATLISVDSNACHLFTYDMAKNAGTITHLQQLPSLVTNEQEDLKTKMRQRLPQITICNGMVFLVARCLGARTPVRKVGQVPVFLYSCVGLWMMSFGTWEFVTKLPLHLLKKVVTGSDGTDFIIVSNSCNQIFFVLKGSIHMLVYDVRSSTWALLHGCPADYSSHNLYQSAFYESLIWLSAV